VMNKYDTPCPRCEDFGRRLTNAENELYMARADKAQTLMEAERAMAQIREATAKVVAERDAAVADAVRKEREIRADERQKCWADIMRRFSQADRRRIAGNLAHDWTVSKIEMEAALRDDLAESFVASVSKAEAVQQLKRERDARIDAIRARSDK